jgi:hypothetical protein
MGVVAFGPPDDVQGDGLMRIAAEAANLQVAVPGIQGIAEHRRWLRRSLIAEHAFVPSLAGEPVRLFARFLGSLRCHTDRDAVEVFARFGGHSVFKRGRQGRANYQSLGARNGRELLRVGGVKRSLRYGRGCAERKSGYSRFFFGKAPLDKAPFKFSEVCLQQ